MRGVITNEDIFTFQKIRDFPNRMGKQEQAPTKHYHFRLLSFTFKFLNFLFRFVNIDIPIIFVEWEIFYFEPMNQPCRSIEFLLSGRNMPAVWNRESH